MLHFALHTTAADRADERSIGKDQHLCPDFPRCRSPSFNDRCKCHSVFCFLSSGQVFHQVFFVSACFAKTVLFMNEFRYDRYRNLFGCLGINRHTYRRMDSIQQFPVDTFFFHLFLKKCRTSTARHHTNIAVWFFQYNVQTFLIIPVSSGHNQEIRIFSVRNLIKSMLKTVADHSIRPHSSCFSGKTRTVFQYCHMKTDFGCKQDHLLRYMSCPTDHQMRRLFQCFHKYFLTIILCDPALLCLCDLF